VAFIGILVGEHREGERKRDSAMSTATAGLQGTGSNQNSNSSNNGGASPLEDFHFSSSQLLSLLDSKDDALQGLPLSHPLQFLIICTQIKFNAAAFTPNSKAFSYLVLFRLKFVTPSNSRLLLWIIDLLDSFENEISGSFQFGIEKD